MNKREVLEAAATTPTWLGQALEKLHALSQFKEGWDSYGGLPLQPAVRAHAERLLNELKDEELPVPAVVLGSGGTVQFEWRLQGRELEVEVLPSGVLAFLKVLQNGQTEEGHISRDQAKELRLLAGWLVSG